MVEIKVIGSYSDGRLVYRVGKDVPMYGYIAFGVIDRGTNVLQVRPTTICPLNCIFCSVDAGPFSRNRWAEYIVDKDAIIDAVEYAIRYKGGGIEALIDTIGEPLTYPNLIELVKGLKEIPGVRSVALETHGALLSEGLVRRLEEAGLDRINLSIDTLDPNKARFLQGVRWYDVRRVMRVAEFIARETSIDLHVTPLWIPGVNDKDVIDVIMWAMRIGAGKKWPPVTIQKYNVHKYGRKVPGVRPISWKRFWRWLEELEGRLGIKLRPTMEEFGMRYAPRIPCPVRRGDIVRAYIIARGWVKGEYLGIIPDVNRLVAVIKYRGGIRKNVYIKIIEDKDCLLIGRFIGEVE